MEELKKVLEKYLTQGLIQIMISGSKRTQEEQKVRVRPVLLKGDLRFQAEIFRGTKAFHENLDKEEAMARILAWMTESFKQLQLTSVDGAVHVLVSKKGKVTIREAGKPGSVKASDLTHNKKKKYLLEEGTPVDFLVDLGVMTPKGQVVHARYDKHSGKKNGGGVL